MKITTESPEKLTEDKISIGHLEQETLMNTQLKLINFIQTT